MWSVCLISSDLQEQAGNTPSCGTVVAQDAFAAHLDSGDLVGTLVDVSLTAKTGLKYCHRAPHGLFR